MEPTEKTTIRPLAQELGRIPVPNTNEITVILKNGRLEITAHVNQNGLHEMIGMLTHWEAVLGRIAEWNKP